MNPQTKTAPLAREAVDGLLGTAEGSTYSIPQAVTNATTMLLGVGDGT